MEPWDRLGTNMTCHQTGQEKFRGLQGQQGEPEESGTQTADNTTDKWHCGKRDLEAKISRLANGRDLGLVSWGITGHSR